MTIETIINGIEGKNIDKSVNFLIEYDKSKIDKKYYKDLIHSITTILISNNFDKETTDKLDELLEFFRENDAR